MKILLVNGPNINMLGTREPEIYGSTSYEELCQKMSALAKSFNIDLECLQSNHEGVLVDGIQAALGKFDGIIINPAAFSHYSIALLDALKAVNIPTIEVHISNIHTREDFRKHSVTAPACIAQISGLGLYGYEAALGYFAQKLSQ